MHNSELFLRTHLFFNTCIKYLNTCFVLDSILDVREDSENQVPEACILVWGHKQSIQLIKYIIYHEYGEKK